MKRCSKCETEKLITDYNKNKARLDGLQVYCRECEHEYLKKYRSSEKSKLQARARVDKHREKDKEAYLAWRRSNYQKRKAEGRLKQYPQNLDKHRINQSRRRARLKSNGVFEIIDKDMKRLLESDCFYCGDIAETFDHVVPVARGGQHSIGNLVAACKSCNYSKRHDLLIIWKNKMRRNK